MCPYTLPQIQQQPRPPSGFIACLRAPWSHDSEQDLIFVPIMELLKALLRSALWRMVAMNNVSVLVEVPEAEDEASLRAWTFAMLQAAI